jgi:3-oxoacyl-[acyl-carrier-protein] synthase-3
MAVQASLRAMKAAGCSSETIDCLICCGVSNPFREPTFALILAQQLAMTGDYFDVNDTCHGFMKSIELASLYLQTGKYKTIMIVTSENPYETAAGLGIRYTVRDATDVDNKFAALTVGSGAAAMIVGCKDPGGAIVHFEEKKGSKQWDASILTIPTVAFPTRDGFEPSGGFKADARLISSQIIKDMPPFILHTILRWGMKMQTIDYWIMHQLGNNVTFALLDQAQIAHEKAPINTFREYGNLACANIPVNLAIAEERHLIKTGDSIVLLSMACGLTYGLMYILW